MPKLLIIDDEEEILKLYQYILLSEGFEVLAAANGNDGLRLAIQESPDLIILDVMMPGIDGAETARHLLANKKTENIPIVFLTSLVSKEEMIKKTDGNLYISKLLSEDVFIAKIKEILANRRELRK